MNIKAYYILPILIIVLVSFILILELEIKDFQILEAVLDVQNQNQNVSLKIENCQIKTQEKIVRGNSLEPLIKPGQIVKAMFGYFDCNKIKREDIVLFRHGGRENYLIKIIKGIPGDRFELRKGDFGWNIIINNEIVKNSEKNPYLISEQGYRMLSLYVNDFRGVIPEGAYLLLGDQVAGSLDSTAFGLVHKNEIIAKVIE